MISQIHHGFVHGQCQWKNAAPVHHIILGKHLFEYFCRSLDPVWHSGDTQPNPVCEGKRDEKKRHKNEKISFLYQNDDSIFRNDAI